MPTITSGVTVRGPVQAVFDYMAAPESQVEWNPHFLSLDTPPDGPLAPGTRYRGTVKNFGAMEIQYVDFEPPRRFEIASDNRMGHMTHAFVFEPNGAETHIAQIVGFQPKGVARIIAPLMVLMMRRMVKNLDRQIERTVAAHLSHAAGA